jgi:hypothetical protein
VRLEAENTETKDATLMAGWQKHVDSEPVKDSEWSDSDIHQLPGQF